jgi:hypothetical protein
VCLEIFAWLIEHPEGRFIVDTGDRVENSTPGYLPWWNPFFTTHRRHVGGSHRRRNQ